MTAINILGACVGAFLIIQAWLNGRMLNRIGTLEKQVDCLDEEMHARIEALEAKQAEGEQEHHG